jgi:hypothetical protein
MGVKLGLLHRGKKIGRGYVRIGCSRRHLDLRDTGKRRREEYFIIYILLTKYHTGDQMKIYEVDGVCGEDDGCIYYYGGRTCEKETTWKT